MALDSGSNRAGSLVMMHFEPELQQKTTEMGPFTCKWCNESDSSVDLSSSLCTECYITIVFW